MYAAEGKPSAFFVVSSLADSVFASRRDNMPGRSLKKNVR